MCLIVIKQKGVAIPKKEYLENGYDTNDDGMGIAYLKKGSDRVVIKKDFKYFNDFYEWITANIKKSDTCLIHFRLATSGKKDNGNNHPFPITSNKMLMRQVHLRCRFAVVHNGIISDFSNSNKKYSDTQKYIMAMLSPAYIKDNLHEEAIRTYIKAYLSGDKLAILTYSGIIYTFGEYEKKDGCYYSNSSYLMSKFSGYSSYDYLNRKYPTATSKSISEYYGNVHKKVHAYVTDEIVKCVCSNCNVDAHCKKVYYDGMQLQLCKPCRRKAKKGKLILYNEGYDLYE